MADNVVITPGTGATIAADEVSDGTLGSVKVQYVKLMDGTLNGTDKALVDSSGLKVNLGADNDVTVSGTVTVDTGLTTQTDALTDTELRATPVPVSGTVAVTNAGITTIAGAVSGTEMQVDVLTMPTTAVTNAGLTALNGAISGTEVQVDVLTMPTVTVTATNLDVQSGGADLATSTQAAAIQTAVETIDNAISGSEMQVDVVAALPAGNNNIGDVDVASLPATPAGTNAIGKLLPPDIDVTAHTNYAKKYYTNSGAVTDGIVWSPAAGKRWHIHSLFVQTSAAATVTFEDDKAGGDEVVLKMELAANSGTVIPFPEKYPLASGEDAADFLVTTSAGNIYVTCVGYEV